MSKNTKRDLNEEFNDDVGRKYAYNFDYDVMYPYMMKSFVPFFKDGSLLELGSFKGEFTELYQEYFDDITCVEGSDDAASEAKKKLSDKVKIVVSLFEDPKLKLPKKYKNVALTHVLEHLDDPVKVLKRINDEWLADDGRLFLVSRER
jgi:SAM-dependent methyltransferase